MNQWVIIWGSFFFKMFTHYTKEWITLAARPDNLQQNLNCALLKWLDGVFQGHTSQVCLRRHALTHERFVKIITTVVLDIDENLLWSGLPFYRVVIATKWRHYLLHLKPYFSALGIFFSKIVHKIFFPPVAASMLAKFKLNLWERYEDILGSSCNWKNAFEIWRNVSYCCPQKYETRERYS